MYSLFIAGRGKRPIDFNGVRFWCHSRLSSIVSAAVLIQFAVGVTTASALQPIAELVPSTSGQVTRFANSMSVDGDRVLVGAAQGGFLFQKSDITGSSWSQLQFMTTTAGLRGSPFGAPVALSDDVAMFGAYSLFSAAQQAGGAYIFRSPTSSGSFVLTQTVWPADSEIHDQFGDAVMIGDGLAFIGADNDSHNGKQSTGTVTLYRDRNDGSQQFEEIKKFAPTDITPGQGFGATMDLEKDRLVVSAVGYGMQNGAAYVYERDAGGSENWGQTAKLTLNKRFFGGDVAIDENTILVGERINNQGDGSVNVFELDPSSGDWQRIKELTPPAGPLQRDYGFTVALQGDFAIVSSLLDSATGEVFVYNRNEGGPGSWGLITTLASPDPNAATYFGASVAIMGNLALVGTLGIGENPLGTVYVYAIPEPSCALLILASVLCLGIQTRELSLFK